MGAAEIQHRIHNVVKRRSERRRWKRNDKIEISGNANSGFLENCTDLLPGTQVEVIEDLRKYQPGYFESLRSAAASAANSILSGNSTFLGYSFDVTVERINWHSDFRTGFEWDRTFYADLELYDLGDHGDVKYPWELSRHQFLCDLSRNYLLNQCERSAELAVKVLLDWIAENPLYEGVNWTSSLEVGMRAISWIWTLAGLEKWNGWNADNLGRIYCSLREHGEYLSQNFSEYSSPYNHLIGESVGLLWIASVLKNEKLSSNWQQKGLAVLQSSAGRQFYEDGFNVEQATSYHYFTLGFLVLAQQAIRVQGLEVSFDDVMRKAFVAGAHFRRPDGTWPAIGDLDSARAIPVSVERFWSFDSLTHQAAVILEEPKLKLDPNNVGHEVFWLSGVDGVRRWHALESTNEQDSFALLSQSGYAIGTNSRTWVLLDGGPIAEGLFSDSTPSTAHGHADLLQLLVAFNSENCTDDLGMPFYGGDQNWVDFFRSSKAHNTVSIDGAPFVRNAGRLAWSNQVSRPVIDGKSTDGNWFLFARVQWPGVSHERHVCVLPDIGLWCVDVIESSKPRNASIHWQLPYEDGNVRLSNKSSIQVGSKCITVDCPKLTPLKLEFGRNPNPIGWLCDGYGEKRRACRVSGEFVVDQKVTVTTTMGAIDLPKLQAHIGDSAELSRMSSMEIGKFHHCLWTCEEPVRAT